VNPASMRKFEKTIIGGLVNIYQNNLSVKDVFEKRIIPSKAFSLSRILNLIKEILFKIV
jgi:hypothetical protein